MPGIFCFPVEIEFSLKLFHMIQYSFFSHLLYLNIHSCKYS